MKCQEDLFDSVLKLFLKFNLDCLDLIYIYLILKGSILYIFILPEWKFIRHVGMKVDNILVEI